MHNNCRKLEHCRCIHTAFLLYMMHSSINVNSSPHALYVYIEYSVRSDSLSPTIFQHVCYAFHSYLPCFALGCLAGHVDLARLLASAGWPGIALQPIFR